MPATVTHSYFTIDVFDCLPDDIKNNINLNKMKMFGQSFDPLMFYNLFSPLPGMKIRKLQNYCHTHKTKDFFINMLNIMKEKNLGDDIECFTFLNGFICHFVLDSTIHPYVIYKSGVFNKKKPNTYKYNNVHAFMETFIDNDMIKRREDTNPYAFRIDKFCFDIEPFSINLDYLIDMTFYKTYKIKDMSYIYYKSLKQMKSAIRLFRMDKYGIKKNIYKLVDTFAPKKTYRFEAISYHYRLDDRHNYLNSNNSLWRNPTTYDMTSNESFIDLYMRSIKIAKIMICASYDYLHGKDIDLDRIFHNNSYLTGLDCDIKKELKYFEF